MLTYPLSLPPNRTIVELKFMHRVNVFTHFFSPNRTIVELKYAKSF